MVILQKKGRTPEPPPKTPHTPEKPGPPGVPSKVWVSKGRSGRVVASSVPPCLQEEGQGMGQGDRRRARALAALAFRATLALELVTDPSTK